MNSLFFDHLFLLKRAKSAVPKVRILFASRSSTPFWLVWEMAKKTQREVQIIPSDDSVPGLQTYDVAKRAMQKYRR
jgi:hypothetical protein